MSDCQTIFISNKCCSSTFVHHLHHQKKNGEN